MSIKPKIIHKFNAILIKISTTFFSELGKKTIRKSIWKHKRPQIAKAILKNKIKAGSITTPDLKTYYRVVVIQTGWYWYTHRDQWRPETPEANPHMCSQLIFDKRTAYNPGEKFGLCNKYYWDN